MDIFAEVQHFKVDCVDMTQEEKDLPGMGAVCRMFLSQSKRGP